MQFIYQPLTWGFLLVAVPVLIHLINMMRHRRVRWAAMEFLLQSYKKHRKWIWLKQLILLLLRMAAIAVVVAMLAQWVTQGQWLDVFGGKVTHHYVLLDDSFSMADRAGATRAFDAALSAIRQIGAQAAAQESPQQFTLIRFSRAARGAASPEGPDLEQIADFNAEPVGGDFDIVLENWRNTFEVTELAVGPGPALSVLQQLLEESSDEDRVVYIVSDFRANQWQTPAELRETLRAIERSPAEIQLVGCVRESRQNLAITRIEPAHETRAAGVPLSVDIAVKNFGSEVARNVQLKVRTAFFDNDRAQQVSPDAMTADVDELPTVLIQEIAPGQVETRRIQASFPQPGRHVVEATLPDDPVPMDNHRWCVIEFPKNEPVLIVDGSTDQRHAYYLESAFRPGGRAETGVAPERKTAAFLRDASPEVLADYRVIYLLDVPRLDDRAIENLESYVRDGGGLAFFAGPNMDISFYNNRLYRGGEGLFPVPLVGDDLLLPSAAEEAPDIEVLDHPVFTVFLGERNPFIRLITIEQYLRPLENWKPVQDQGVQVAAYLRNRMPLAVDKKIGDGRVMAFLTTAAPIWNNWGNDPSFVVTLLKLQSYLAEAQRPNESRPVGSRITLQLEVDKYRDDLQFVTPGDTPETRIAIERQAIRPEPNSPIMIASIGAGPDGVGETDHSGLYEAWPVTTAGQADVRRYGLNVDAAEGDLTVVDSKSLLSSLDPVKAEFRYADQYHFEIAGLTGNNRSLLLMCVLLVVLVAEQLMAYSASYHPARNITAAG